MPVNSIGGRTAVAGIGKETVRGTAVAPTYWIQADDRNLTPQTTVAKDMDATGQIIGTTGAKVVRKWSEPEFSAFMSDGSFGLIALAALGQVTTTPNSPEVGVHTHDFTVATQSNSHPSLTIALKDSILDHQAAFAMLNELSFEMVTDNFARFTASFIATLVTTATNTPVTNLTESRFAPRHVTVKLADNVAGLDAALAIPVASAGFNLTKGVAAFFATGQDEPCDIANGTFDATGEIVTRLQDSTYFGLLYSGATKAMRIEMIDTDTLIGAASNPTVRIDFGAMHFETWERDNDKDGFIEETSGMFASIPDNGDPFMTIRMINTEATY